MGWVTLDGVLIGVTDEAKYAVAPADDLTDEAVDRYAYEGTRIVRGCEVPGLVPVRTDRAHPSPVAPAE